MRSPGTPIIPTWSMTGIVLTLSFIVVVKTVHSASTFGMKTSHGCASFVIQQGHRQHQQRQQRKIHHFPSVSSILFNTQNSDDTPKKQGNTNGDNNTNNNMNDYFKNESVESIQQRLAQYGLEWKQTPISISNNNNNKMTRVPGCVATVYVQAVVTTKTIITENYEMKHKEIVSIMGNSDAILSRGLLYVLNRYLQSLPGGKDDVLKLDPNSIADELRIRAALSKGRNDGLANMLRIVQDQISMVVEKEDELQESTSNGKGIVDEVVSATIAATTKTSSSSFQNDSKNIDNEPSPKVQQQQQQQQQPTVALLLSGGVDSSVALRLLQQQGYNVTAYYLKIWLEDEMAHLNECPWEDDLETCHAVCNQAGVNLKVISLQEEYHARVMQHTLQEASMGRTPNPDILCNSRVKFGCFLEYLKKEKQETNNVNDNNDDDEYMYDFIASGHYAQLYRDYDNNGSNQGAVVRLRRAPDPVKDQSYFLCALNQKQLSKLLFPIGHLEKVQVRQLANEEFQLPNRNRPDSQGLCFLGKVKFRDFLQIHLGTKTGDIVDAFTGQVIGRHDGVWYHTVGQRKGIGKSLFDIALAHGPWYVVAKDPSQNIVYASNMYDEDVFTEARSEFHVENIHWIAGRPPEDMIIGEPYRLEMKIRHGPRLVPGTITLVENDNNEDHNNHDNGNGIIKLDAKDGGLAPGQYAVFYKQDDTECLGGGIISERHWARFLVENGPRKNVDEPAAATQSK